ncbi:MAG TPA: hypothetical protein VER37_02955, partial [Thermomicrobiales bacterium]|nr:hypothetical protein [Thermomicrobiales bacterium]
WSAPRDASPDDLAEWEAYQAKMLVPDETITAWIDVSGEPLARKWAALREHATQISQDNPFFRFGLEGGDEWWSREAFILRGSSVQTQPPEDDLFAGIA